MSHKWSRITDLSESETPANAEIQSISDTRRELGTEWRQRPEYQKFELELARLWAIETGLIEGLYSFDQEITQLLIEQGIEAAHIPHKSGQSPEIVAAMIADHKEALDGICDYVKSNRELSTSYIKELHALMTRHQEHAVGIDIFGNRTHIPLRHGVYKIRPNNPSTPESGGVHEYCPPEQVPGEMENLVAWHKSHMEAGVSPEVEAAWLHHRFVQIHPFQDGNGRVARALATWVFLKANWFPLVVLSRDRTRYFQVLKAADTGDLQPLVNYFAKIQKKAFVDALQIAKDVKSI